MPSRLCNLRALLPCSKVWTEFGKDSGTDLGFSMPVATMEQARQLFFLVHGLLILV